MKDLSYKISILLRERTLFMQEQGGRGEGIYKFFKNKIRIPGEHRPKYFLTK